MPKYFNWLRIQASLFLTIREPKTGEYPKQYGKYHKFKPRGPMKVKNEVQMRKNMKHKSKAIDPYGN